MAKLTWALGMVGALALSACGQAQSPAASQPPPPPPVDQAAQAAKAQLAQQDANEKAVRAFFTPGITMDQRLALMSPDYIQHNPVFVRFAQINNISNGRDAFKAMLDTLSKLRGGGQPFGPPAGAAARGPRPPQGDMFYKIMADADLVTVIHQRYAPDPQHAGKFYETYGFDTFRMQDGKMAEHWDDATISNPLPPVLRAPMDKLHYPKQTQPVY